MIKYIDRVIFINKIDEVPKIIEVLIEKIKLVKKIVEVIVKKIMSIQNN